MEHFKEMALEEVNHKPLCWFRYVDGTFIIWPHGSGKLINILDHLNSVHKNIQLVHYDLMAHWVTKFTINPPTPTSRLYFPCWCTRPDEESMHSELEFLRATFRQNDYSDRL
jgi:hypothetical protein